ncbi:MAG: PilX N-terminal domain-containing pilus assembly protein [Desulfobacterales bacterium]|nr:PilX N-terminal domain-containing pilus assembly protein [Desulfobacterales bacterium]
MKRGERIDTEQRGSIINIVLLVLVILTLIGFVLIRSARIDTRIAANEKQETTAFHAADAGLSRALNMLEGNGDGSWLGSPQSFGDATYLVTMTDYTSSSSSSISSVSSSSAVYSYDIDGDGYILIRTTGTINKATVAVEAIYQEGTGMISWREVE